MNELTHLDLFSGIGGFAIAARNAGFRTIGFSEVEPYACRVLAERFPGVPNLGDVRNGGGFVGLGTITVLTGGYPCQPFSLAGDRRGEADHRHLWPAKLALIKTLRPAWTIGENVLGHFTLGLDQVLSDLVAIGYAAQSFIIPACAVRANHIRNRVWIVGCDTHRNGVQGRASNPQARREESVDEQLSRPVFPDVRDAIPAARVHRANHGVSSRLDCARNRALGNAIVPQVAEPFFHWIRQIEQGEIK